MDNHSVILLTSNQDLSSIMTWINQRLETRSSMASNPNFIQLVPIDPTKPSIGVSQVRELLTRLSFQAYRPTARIVLIMPADSLTLEAQNALLKVLEEPPKETHFYLVTQQASQLLTTIQSRCQIVRFDSAEPANKETNQPLQTIDNKIDRQLINNYTAAIKLAEKIKTEFEAVNLLKQLNKESELSAEKQQLILTGLTQLNKNFNIRLTLEHLFFQLVDQTK